LRTPGDGKSDLRGSPAPRGNTRPRSCFRTPRPAPMRPGRWTTPGSAVSATSARRQAA